MKTWNTYLLSYFNLHKDYVQQTLNLPQLDIDKFSSVLNNTAFDLQGVYLHGDFGLRNAIVESKYPLSLKIFDPNPLIGDPSWDIATIYKTAEFYERKHKYFPQLSCTS